jgi:hypothetical protein
MYTAAHAAIRKDPSRKRDAMQKGYFPYKMKAPRSSPKDPNAKYPVKRWNAKKQSIQQRKNRIKQKLTAAGIPSIPKLVLQK